MMDTEGNRVHCIQAATLIFYFHTIALQARMGMVYLIQSIFLLAFSFYEVEKAKPNEQLLYLFNNYRTDMGRF